MKTKVLLMTKAKQYIININKIFGVLRLLTLEVLVTTIDAQWEGMGDVGSSRYEPVLLPPCPTVSF